VLALHVTSTRDRTRARSARWSSSTPRAVKRGRVDVTPQLAAAYARAWEAHDRELEHFCGRYDIGYLRADADRPVRGDRHAGVP
jgi:hypothetical protein